MKIFITCLIALILVSTSFADGKSDRRGQRKERRQAMKAEHKAEKAQMKKEITACGDKVCKCGVRKSFQAKKIAKLKVRLAKMEQKQSEWDCSKKTEKK